MKKNVAIVALCLLLLMPSAQCVLGAEACPPATAAPNLARPPEVAAPASAPSPTRQVLDAILADPVFGRQSEETQWRPRQRAENKSGPPSWWKTLERLIEWLSQGLRWIAWGVVALVAAAFIYLLIRYRQFWLPARGVRRTPPDFLFGLDVRPDSLPPAVAAAARQALAAGRVREALSLLYRGALVALIHQRQVNFRAGDTEDDCLARVGACLDPAGATFFRHLLAAWREVAYAHRLPQPSQLEALCAGWVRHFGDNGGGR